MEIAPLPENEDQRLNRLALYRVLDTPPEEAFDRITRIVAETIGVPTALVSLVDKDRQWFKSRRGLDAEQTPRDVAFCAHAILGDDIFEVEDATRDPRFADNPLVTHDPSIRFYAGAPLRTPDGYKIGTLCALDQEPRKLSDAERQLLADLSNLVVDELELRVALRSAMGEVAEGVRQQNLKDEFISTVTHELRTPLTSIRGSLGLLDAGALGELPGKAAGVISVANRNVDHLIELVNDLLDFQSLELESMEFDFGVVDSTKLLTETCENLQGYAHENDVALEVSGEGPAILGDKGRLAQVLTNILSNAIKFSPKGETVTASMSVDGDTLRYSVADRGEGIPDEFRKQIFSRFAQASGKNKIKGTGLGLAISKAIAEAHRGEIRFESEVGKGTTFYFELPIRQSTVI